MQIVGGEVVRGVVSLTAAREAVHDAFCALAEGTVVAPDEFTMLLANGGELHVKGAHLGGPYFAFKSASGQFPEGGNSGFSVVLSSSTGAPVAIIDDGGWLTEIRTAAASAVSARALARPESTRLAILGGGCQAAFQVAALREAFAIESVSAWSRTAATAERFAGENDAVAAGTVAAAVADADIVICCTPSREPLLDMDMLRPGAHVIAMGADVAGKRELSDDVVTGCDLLVADQIEITSKVGELAHVPSERDRCVELGDVLTGRAAARTAADQITVSDHCGLGIQDAAMAQLVMEAIAGGDSA